MNRLAILLAIPAAALVLAGCSSEKRIPAVGPAFEIVVMAPEGMAVLAEEVRTVLGEDVVTIRPEPRYQIEVDTLEEYRFYKTRKLLFAVGPRDADPFAKLLGKTTGTRTQTAYPGLWVEADPFAAGQVMFWLAGDPQTIVQDLRARGDELVDIVEDATVDLIVRSLFRVGEQPDARATLRARWGWGVRLPSEFVVEDRSTADRRFVRIWHDAPVEQLFVSWEDGRVERTADEWVQRRHELAWYHLDRDEVVFDHAGASPAPTPFGPDGWKLTGLWENNQYTIGGPFESWAFYCDRDDRTYLVDLSVYAPDRDKLPLLRVLRAVASTFRCGCSPGVPAPGTES